MILSVSRRTDIPCLYFDWFVNRLREGWLLVRNPFNPSKVSRVPLSPSMVECIVFWTKNPERLLAQGEALEAYPWYIHYTINAYGSDLEGNLPELSRRLETFCDLSDKIGAERVIWRYSPVIHGRSWSAARHLEAFATIAGALSGFTLQCHLGFLDMYAKIAPRMWALGVVQAKDAQMRVLARQLADLARDNGIAMSACGAQDLTDVGVAASSCVDGGLIQRITGKRMVFRKDPGQRGVCRCVESVDVGTYQTCLNGCAYCYANHSHAAAVRRAALYDPSSPLLCDTVGPGDLIVDRTVRLHAAPQHHQLLLKA